MIFVSNIFRWIFHSLNLKTFVTKRHIWLGWFSCQIFSDEFSTHFSLHDLLSGFQFFFFNMILFFFSPTNSISFVTEWHIWLGWFSCQIFSTFLYMIFFQDFNSFSFTWFFFPRITILSQNFKDLFSKHFRIFCNMLKSRSFFIYLFIKLRRVFLMLLARKFRLDCNQQGPGNGLVPRVEVL